MLGQPELHDRLTLAKELVRRVGQAARSVWLQGPIAAQRKGPQDFVTEIDRTTEQTIRTDLLGAFPDDQVLGEEFGGSNDFDARARALWVVDPIDGTANYMRGRADWAVSLGLVLNGCIELGIVYDGGRGLLYWAQRGHGAFCDTGPVACAKTTGLDQAVVIVGTNQDTPMQAHMHDLQALRGLGAEYRRHGSAATGLLMAADGRADAYHERRLNAWDAVGGLCIAVQSGAKVAHPPMADFLRGPGAVLCAIPPFFADLDYALGHQNE